MLDLVVAGTQRNGLHFKVAEQHNEHAALITPANLLALGQFDIIECEEESLIVLIECWRAEQVNNFRFGEDLESFLCGHNRYLKATILAKLP